MGALEDVYGGVEKEIVYLGIKAMYKFVRSTYFNTLLDLE